MTPKIDTELLCKTIRKLKKIGDGVDPFTEIEYDDYVLNFLKENRELFIDAIAFLSILDYMYRGNSQTDTPFYVIKGDLECLKASADEVTVSELTNYINSVISRPGMKKLKPPQITNWLVNQGVLETVPGNDGYLKKVVGDDGWRVGIRTEYVKNSLGIGYPLNLYSEKAQTYIFQHLWLICEENSD